MSDTSPETALPQAASSSLNPRDAAASYDQVRAEQTQSMLDLARSMLDAIKQGIDSTSAQAICDLLLPASDAIAVAITDTESIMGYAGHDKEHNPIGGDIRTKATYEVLSDGKMRVIRTAGEIGLPSESPHINAAIITPLRQGGRIIGAMKFYYPYAELLTETQLSIARGFGELLSSQLDATAAEEQREMATSLELKMLQSQINPHFLFNTINTIASLVRTDPTQARELLREFARFYRSTLEDASDLIPLSREVDQTKRYLTFEVARFGEDRLQFEADIPDDLAEYLVPAFVVQPLVENAVRHAMPSEGTLHIRVHAHRDENTIVVTIEDDGVGMSTDVRDHIKGSRESKGLGFAVRNINERVRGYYGPGSRLSVESTKGKGTTVELYLHNACSLDAYKL